MYVKHSLLNQKSKIVLLSTLLLLTISISQAQTGPDIPSDHPISIAAPNLPKVTRHDGLSDAFYGYNYVYNLGENESNLLDWKENYPVEYENYVKVASEYFSTTDESTLSDTGKEVYADLKSQWLMLNQLN